MAEIIDFTEHLKRKETELKVEATKEQIYETSIVLTFESREADEVPYWFTQVAKVPQGAKYSSFLCIVDIEISFWERIKVMIKAFREQSRRLEEARKTT